MPTKKWDQLTLAQRKGLRKGQIRRWLGGLEANLLHVPAGLVADKSMMKRLEAAADLVRGVEIDCILLTLREEEKK